SCFHFILELAEELSELLVGAKRFKLLGGLELVRILVAVRNGLLEELDDAVRITPAFGLFGGGERGLPGADQRNALGQLRRHAVKPPGMRGPELLLLQGERGRFGRLAELMQHAGEVLIVIGEQASEEHTLEYRRERRALFADRFSETVCR